MMREHGDEKAVERELRALKSLGLPEDLRAVDAVFERDSMNDCAVDEPGRGALLALLERALEHRLRHDAAGRRQRHFARAPQFVEPDAAERDAGPPHSHFRRARGPVQGLADAFRRLLAFDDVPVAQAFRARRARAEYLHRQFGRFSGRGDDGLDVRGADVDAGIYLAH